MDAAVAAMHDFLDKVPKNDKVGLVTFSDKVQVRSVPTTDRAAVAGTLDTLNPETGTALGDGVEAAVKLAVQTLALDGVRPRPGKYVPAAIVLESDGAQNRGKLTPAEAGGVAKDAGVRVFGVALGTKYGQVTEGSGILRTIPVPPDPGTVRLLARLSGGESFSAETAASLNSTYRHLGTSVGKHRERGTSPRGSSSPPRSCSSAASWPSAPGARRCRDGRVSTTAPDRGRRRGPERARRTSPASGPES